MRPSIDFAALAKRVLKQGHTTYTLGRELGLSQPAVSRLASGRTRSISADAAIGLIYLAGGAVLLPVGAENTDDARADHVPATA
jgi:hypothetical protein